LIPKNPSLPATRMVAFIQTMSPQWRLSEARRHHDCAAVSDKRPVGAA
jgi:hypothetical protein